MRAERPVLLTIQPVPWEGPHRIADACGALDMRRAAPLDGDAWGVLFHAEADAALVEAWLREPTMAEEARQAIGRGAAAELPSRAREIEPDLIARSQPGFEAFARLVAEHSSR